MKMRRLLIFISALFSLFVLSTKIARGVTFFEDNFDDNDISDWTVSRNMQWGNPSQSCLYQGSPTSWEAKNGTAGIKIDGPGCVTELIPSSISIDSDADYSFELDMNMSQTINMDRNFVFKYQDSQNWYGIHTVGSKIYTQKVVGGTEYFLPNWVSSYSFQDNQTYHFRIEITSAEIRVFVNGDLRATVTDSSPSFSNSKAGLQASVGGISSSEVWFDNVKVEELAPTLDPLILLPGLGASWNTEAMIGGKTDIPPEQWQMTPFVKCYDGLIKSLENAGYKQGENFFVYNYDWRRPLDQTADQLKGFIDQNLSPPGTKIDLVGHSLGGLVARTYAQKYGTDKIDQLITLGSPHNGVVQSYLAWEGGQVSDHWDWSSVALALLLQINKTNFQTDVQTIRQMVPSAKDILPIFNFLKRGSTEINWQTQSQKNDYLNNLKTNVSQIFDQLVAVFGTSKNTLRWYQVENRNTIDRLLGKWEDGKPKTAENENGDQTILASSAQAAPDPAESLNLTHRDLVQDQTGIEKVFEVLELSPNNIVELPIFNRTNTLVFLLASPAKLKVTDPNNNKFLSDQDGFVIINEPLTGQYQTEITPTGQGGDYHLYLGQLTEDEDFWTQIKDKVTFGETDTFQFDINPQSPQTDPLIDADGLFYLKLVRSRITPLALSSRTINYLDAAIALTENHQYSQAKTKVEKLLDYLFDERQRKPEIQTKEEIYLAVLDAIQAYLKLCQAGGISFNQKTELKNLTLTEKLLTLYRRRIEILDGQGKATNSQAASFTKAEDNLNKAKAAYPTNLPETHIFSLITQFLLYEIK